MEAMDKTKRTEIIEKMKNILEMLNNSLNNAGIDTEVENVEDKDFPVVNSAVYVKELTSYPVYGQYTFDLKENGICEFVSLIVLSYNFKEEERLNIQKMVNEFNSSLVFGNVACNPESNAIVYRYNKAINSADNKADEDIVKEILALMDKLVYDAALMLSVIEKNDYEADIDFAAEDDTDDGNDFDLDSFNEFLDKIISEEE